MDPNEMRRRREAREGRRAFWAYLHRGSLPSVRPERGEGGEWIPLCKGELRTTKPTMGYELSGNGIIYKEE